MAYIAHCCYARTVGVDGNRRRAIAPSEWAGERGGLRGWKIARPTAVKVEKVCVALDGRGGCTVGGHHGKAGTVRRHGNRFDVVVGGRRPGHRRGYSRTRW